MRKWLSLILALAVGCSAKAGESASDEAEVDVALGDVPAAVLEAAKKAVPGIQLSHAEKEVENGVTVYDIEGTLDGKEYEIEVDANGKVLEIENEADDDGDADDDREEENEGG